MEENKTTQEEEKKSDVFGSIEFSEKKLKSYKRLEKNMELFNNDFQLFGIDISKKILHRNKHKNLFVAEKKESFHRRLLSKKENYKIEELNQKSNEKIKKSSYTNKSQERLYTNRLNILIQKNMNLIEKMRGKGILYTESNEPKKTDGRNYSNQLFVTDVNSDEKSKKMITNNDSLEINNDSYINKNGLSSCNSNRLENSSTINNRNRLKLNGALIANQNIIGLPSLNGSLKLNDKNQDSNLLDTSDVSKTTNTIGNNYSLTLNNVSDRERRLLHSISRESNLRSLLRNQIEEDSTTSLDGNKRRGLSLNMSSKKLQTITDKKIRDFKVKNKNLVNNVKFCLKKYNVLSWDLETKIKYAEWKYIIPEEHKYFIDLDAFEKPEHEELEKRKTFYDRVDDIIEDIKVNRQKNVMQKIGKQYGVDLDKGQMIMMTKENEINQLVSKTRETYQALKSVQLRKNKEREKRDIIKSIFSQNEKSLHDINISQSRSKKRKY